MFSINCFNCAPFGSHVISPDPISSEYLFCKVILVLLFLLCLLNLFSIKNICFFCILVMQCANILI